MRKKWIQRACMAGQYYSKVGGGGYHLWRLRGLEAVTI